MVNHVHYPQACREAGPASNAGARIALNNTPTQLGLPWHDSASLSRELEEHTGLSIRLEVTDNASTMIALRHDPHDGADVVLRLHHMFLAAEPAVLTALASWIRRKTDRRAGAVLDRFIEANRHRIRPRPPRTVRIRTRGHHHDLQVYYDEVNAAHFDGTIRARITWGRRGPARHRRTIRFGSYSADHDLIRIHPLLDQAFVPAYFVRYIVFHEMLHAHLGIEEPARGRRRIHTAVFLEREAAHPDHARALAWQQNTGNLRRLLAAGRRGRPAC